MKILIIGQTVWSNENSSGNTLSNLFGLVDAEFAHIYCSGGIPSNKICKKYFQITDKMIIDHIFKLKKIGCEIQMDSTVQESLNFEKKARKYNNTLTRIIRDLTWYLISFDTKAMYDFIDDFQPNIIYAPNFGNLRMNKLIQKIKKKINIPVISLISDDTYSYKKSMKIVERVYQYYVRKLIRQSFKLYDKIYTMTKEQSQEYSSLFQKPIDILRKSAIVSPNMRECHTPVRFIYAGGLYLGRDKIILKVLEALDSLKNKFDAELVIFSSDCSILPNHELLIKKNLVDYETLLTIYENSDVALHVESFEMIHRERTRLSFSTKIVDCLQSGCAVLAIGPSENAGIRFLKEEQAALCLVDENLSDLENNVSEIIKFHDDYQRMALKCLMNKFSAEKNKEKIENDFRHVIKEYQK